MSLILQTLVEDGVGTSAKVIHINNAEDYKNFQELIQRGANLWPDAPASIKRLADLITSGKIMQEYHDHPVHNAPKQKDSNGH